MKRLARIDYAPGRVEIVDRLEAPTPARSTAVRHPEGYLEVDAYIARDGLLRYSDGRDAWLEYRPRSELVDAAASWARTPVTDNHPAKMVTADTWAQVARGVVIDTPTVEGPHPDGASYLRARLLITDAELIRKIEGGQREISIGFTSEVRAETGTAPNGQRFDAIQTGLQGNHAASVPRGRAGPRVRVLMDGDHVPVYDATEIDVPRDEGSHVKITATAPRKGWPAARRDEMGMPTLTAKIVGPDGAEVELPTWAAAIIEEHAEMRAAAAKATEQAAAPPPAPAAAETPPPPPADAAGAPADPPPGEGGETPPEDDDDDEDEDEMKMTPDAVSALVRKRARLVRLADRAGVPAEICDAADETAIARAFVEARMPHAKAAAEKADGAALDALVDVAAAMPATEPPAVRRNPFEAPAAARGDALDETSPLVAFLAAQGYDA